MPTESDKWIWLDCDKLNGIYFRYYVNVLKVCSTFLNREMGFTVLKKKFYYSHYLLYIPCVGMHFRLIFIVLGQYWFICLVVPLSLAISKNTVRIFTNDISNLTLDSFGDD